MNKYILFYLLFFATAAKAQPNNQNGQFTQTANGTLNFASVFTVEFWVKTSDNRSNNTFWQRPYLFGNETDGDNSGDLGITINNGYIGMFEGLSNLNTDQVFLSSSVRINDNNWHHIAAVNNGQTIKLYVDGRIVGSLVSGRQLKTGNAPLTFGAAAIDHSFNGTRNGSNFFSQASFGEARISGVAVYNGNFNPPSSFFSDNNTIAVYHFNSDGNNTGYNSGNDNSTYNRIYNDNVNTYNNSTGSNVNPNPNTYNTNTNGGWDMDPNRPVTFEGSQPINNDAAKQATLYINDTIFLYGRLLLAKKDWSFNNEIGIRFFEGSSKKAKFYKTDEIKGFQMGDSYYEPKLLSQGGPVSTPLKKAIVRRLTPAHSKMNMYEFLSQTTNKNQYGYEEHIVKAVLLVELPNSTDGKLYQFGDNKFVPHFDTRVSAIVADKPELADKIKSKNKDYFYAQITEEAHQNRVWWNIVNEYNQ